MARGLLIAGAALLGATAIFHMTGLDAVSQWLADDRGRIITLLWTTAAVNWAVVACFWAYAAFRPAPVLKLPVWISAIIPFSAGMQLLAMVDSSHPGGYMLVVSAFLASFGAGQMR